MAEHFGSTTQLWIDKLDKERKLRREADERARKAEEERDIYRRNANRAIPRVGELEAKLAEAREALEGWKRVAVIAAVVLEPKRMARGHAGGDALDFAVITIRRAMDGILPPAGDYEALKASALLAETTEGGAGV